MRGIAGSYGGAHKEDYCSLALTVGVWDLS